MPRTLLLVAGPSGSGKSRLTRSAVSESGAVSVSLDDFYFDVDHPDLPMTPMGIPDWDDARTWNLELAIATLGELLERGSAEVPVYDISKSRRVGERTVNMGESSLLLAEGIFAIQACAAARAAAMNVEALWLDRRALANFARRLARDLRERRKAPSVLLRRGVALYRAEPGLRREAMDAGFRPTSMRQAVQRVESMRSR